MTQIFLDKFWAYYLQLIVMNEVMSMHYNLKVKAEGFKTFSQIKREPSQSNSLR